ncbi:MAG: hypothetical protein M0C28_09755 [Candidatus Moduliflexus flocculans]|nr:hypothetical protein [Candidatus Moduliflexus flocculans]
MKEKSKISFNFLNNIIFQRWAIAIVLSVGLTLILAPKLYDSNPEYRHGMIAQENIKADRDFLVEDVNSTQQKRNEASVNTRPIYEYDAEMAITLIKKIKNSFMLVSGQQASQPHKALLEKSLGVSLTQHEFSFLKANNYSDDLLQRLSRVISSFYDNTLVTSERFAKKRTGKRHYYR